MKTILLLLILAAQRCDAYLLTEDIPQLTHAIWSQIVNYAKELESTVNQATQITNQFSQITNEITALERFGNPNYYVNLLGLDSLMNSIGNLEGGIGNTISQYRGMANGVNALGYTANGLYSNLTGMVDRYGNQVRFDYGAFRKFGAVNDMVEGYNVQQRTYNTQLAMLEAKLAAALTNYNHDHTQMGREAYQTEIIAISGQINALGHTTTLAGQRLAAQQAANQNDAARFQEAQRQQQLQERREELRQETIGWARWIGAKP